MDARNKIITIVGSVALIAAATVGGYTLFAGKSNAASAQLTTSTMSSQAPSTTAVSNSSTVASTNGTATAATSSYKDGTYTASSNYSVPHGGQNSISATVTISGGKITAVKTTDNYTDRESSMWVVGFEQEVSADASNQNLAGYSPSRVGGASLTTAAFSDALDAIRSQAQA